MSGIFLKFQNSLDLQENQSSSANKNNTSHMPKPFQTPGKQTSAQYSELPCWWLQSHYLKQTKHRAAVTLASDRVDLNLGGMSPICHAPHLVS